MLSRSVLLCAVLCIATSVAMQYDPALIRKYLDSGDSSFQIHVHWTGNPDERMFSYVTPLNASSSIPATYIVYGTDPSFGSNATGNAYEFGTGGHNFYVHNVLVQGLEPDTTYYYSVGSDETGWSDTHAIYTKSDNIVYAVYGDFGFDNDVSLQELIAEVNASTFDAVIHVGDFAYDLDSNNGEVGDAFMAAIQPIASAVPYMVAPGNHEAYENFTHYINRFSGITQGPANISGSGTNLWYSFDQNNVHWIVIDTEVYHYSVDPNEISRQLAWLEQDLIAANDNRQAVPWIIMFGHKFEYMDHTNWTSFWPLAHKYGVDLYFCGHQHNYQRNFPYYNDDIDQQDVNTYTNPKYMVAVVAGSPGCKEKTSSDMNSSDKLAYSSTDYGYGHLTIYNTTHLLWQWEKTGDGKRKELQHHKKKFHDYMWIIQDNHGPRA